MGGVAVYGDLKAGALQFTNQGAIELFGIMWRTW
jgi:hypothetical protein